MQVKSNKTTKNVHYNGINRTLLYTKKAVTNLKLQIVTRNCTLLRF